MTAPEPVPAAEPAHAAPVAAPWYARYAKALGALVGTLTPGAVFAVLEGVGVSSPPWLVAVVPLLLGTLGAALAPKNAA